MGLPALKHGEGSGQQGGDALSNVASDLSRQYLQLAETFRYDELGYPQPDSSAATLSEPITLSEAAASEHLDETNGALTAGYYDPRVDERLGILTESKKNEADLETAQGSGELAAAQVAQVIPLPSAEEKETAVRPPTQPGTSINLESVRKIIRNERLSKEERTFELLALAWRSGSSEEPLVPPHLMKFIPDNPVDWAAKVDEAHKAYNSKITNLQRLDAYLKARDSIDPNKRSISHMIDEILENTKQYEPTPLMRNFAFMQHVAMGMPEVTRAELITRMILFEAAIDEDRSHKSRNH